MSLGLALGLRVPRELRILLLQDLKENGQWATSRPQTGALRSQLHFRLKSRSLGERSWQAIWLFRGKERPEPFRDASGENVELFAVPTFVGVTGNDAARRRRRQRPSDVTNRHHFGLDHVRPRDPDFLIEKPLGDVLELFVDLLLDRQHLGWELEGWLTTIEWSTNLLTSVVIWHSSF